MKNVPTGWVGDLYRALEDPKVRGVAYRALVIAGPVAIAEGYLTGDQVATILGVVGPLLGVGLAAHNTSTTDPTQPAHQGDTK